MTYLITLIVAYCSIVYELLMAQTLSALMGNTVLPYSITIGVYLASLGVGAMLCKKGDEQDSATRLVRIEIWLSVIGGLAVLFLCSFDVAHRFLGTSKSFFSYGFGANLRPILFFALCHAVIVVIGILSGFEIPLLIALGEAKKPNTMNKVLGVDYFGSLLGSVLFPLILLPKLGVFAVAYLTGLLNAIACALLLIFKPAKGKFLYAKITGVIVVVLLLLLAFTENTQQFFLKKFYYYQQVKSLSSLFDSFEDRQQILEYRSPYQRIHLVNASPNQAQKMIYSQYSDKFKKESNFPQDWWLFLNNRFQFASNTEEFYHEFFVHVPIQWAQPPADVLVLGAGDGIVLRELLKYKEIKKLTLVDIDPKMIHVAQYHPLMQQINHDAFTDPRVNLVVADAFTWLQACDRTFDAIYIDFPAPGNYDLAKLYSIEFYSLVRHCVSEGGFIAADLPSGGESLWDEYYSTLYAVGFETIKPYGVKVEYENTGIRMLQTQFVAQAVGQQRNEYGYPSTRNDPQFLIDIFKKLVRESLENVDTTFVFLQPNKKTIDTAFKNYEIPLYVLNGTRLKLATTVQFDDTFIPDRVNSVFRPTVPEFNFFSVAIPF